MRGWILSDHTVKEGGPNGSFKLKGTTGHPRQDRLYPRDSTLVPEKVRKGEKKEQEEPETFFNYNRKKKKGKREAIF